MPRDAAPSDTSTEATQPTFLTVEEAAAVLRIGRTSAYLLARRWEDTGGVEGLPVVRFGRLLRVPIHELERLASGAVEHTGGLPAVPTAEPERAARPERPPSPKRPAHRSRRKAAEDQASLFPEAS